MATNADTTVVDDDKSVTEEDLRSLKYPEDEVETTQVEDETTEGDEDEEDSEDTSEEDGQTDDQATEEEDDESDEAPAFVKEFDYIKGDTPEEYAKNLEAAYKNSTSEALRLKGELDQAAKAPATAQVEEDKKEETTVTSPLELYAKQKMDEEIQSAYDNFRKEYPQSADPTEYGKFTNQVSTFSRVIMETENRLASPAELYSKAAISLGWQKKETAPDAKDKLGMALKDGAATSKTTSGPSKPAPKGPKVTEAMLKANRQMYPGKTDAEIIEELTPYL
jgi:hypothetical protein